MYQHYHVMPIFASCNVEDIKSGFLSLVKYVIKTYFSVHQMAPLTHWKNIFKITKNVDKYLLKKTLFIIKITLYVPQSNAAPERFLASSNMSKVIFVQVYHYKV